MKKRDKRAFRRWLKDNGLTYERFAHKTGISWITVARWASGKVRPSAVYRAHVLGVFPGCPL